jgi:hypothetical protein
MIAARDLLYLVTFSSGGCVHERTGRLRRLSPSDMADQDQLFASAQDLT